MHPVGPTHTPSPPRAPHPAPRPTARRAPSPHRRAAPSPEHAGSGTFLAHLFGATVFTIALAITPRPSPAASPFEISDLKSQIPATIAAPSAAAPSPAPTTPAAASRPASEPSAAPPATAPAPQPSPAAASITPTPLHPVTPSPSARPHGLPRDKARPAARPKDTPASALWDNPLVRTGGSLAVVLALIFGLAALARKLAARNGGLAAAISSGRRGPAGIIEVLGRYPLARGQTLLLLKLDARVLLVAQTASRLRGGAASLTTLCEVSAPDDVASILRKVEENDPRSPAGRFRDVLDRFDRGDPAVIGDDPALVELPRSRRRAAAPELATPVDHPDAQDAADALPTLQFPVPQPQALRPTSQAPHHAHPAHAAQHHPAHEPPHPYAHTGTDPFSSVRERLRALKGEAHR